MAERMTGLEAPLSLRVITPNGIAVEAACDAVTLPVADGVSGEGGGSMGIRRGHARAMVALAAGVVRARLQGDTVLSIAVESGLASIDRNVVQILAERVGKPVTGGPCGTGKGETG